LRARALVNATGAWVNELLGLLAIKPRQRLRLVKGSHLVLRRQFVGDHAYLLQSPDRRVIFAIPFETNYTLLGTTDVPFHGDPASVSIDQGEQEYLLACANRFFRRAVTAADIVTTYSGVRPLFDDGSSEAAQQVSRDYHLELQHTRDGAAALTVYGGKITTYRRLAEAALSLLRPGSEEGSWTAGVALPGGEIPGADLDQFTIHALQRWPSLPQPMVRRLARLYGTRMAEILGSARHMEDLGVYPGIDLTFAEVRYLVASEWARSANDILWRRTRLGLAVTPSAVDQLQDAVAQLLG
jgi:glycerol-3-phosphate dehydrogenase